MGYHQIAMGVSWENLSVGMQTMTLNFMRAAGLGFLLTGIAILFLLWVPFRKGEGWAKWALVSIGLTQSLIMTIIVNSVRTHTPATPPLIPIALIGILSVIGFLTCRISESGDAKKNISNNSLKNDNVADV
ncbi:MAG: hypothetical protein GY729_12160 [Desulfobacteraceae bacterium]|nr:hypothetical protein [Desulfobacteraceae bacterium]